MSAGNFNDGKLSRQQAINDLDSLVYMLCEVHPNIFSVCTPTTFLSQANAIKQAFPDSLTTLDFYRSVAPLVVAVGDGHTALSFPYEDTFGKEMPRFPLMVSVDANDSTITTRGTLFGVPEGAKIVSINGVSSKEMIEKMLPYASGERTFFKLTNVSNGFLAYFYMLYNADEYDIQYIKNGKIISRKMRGVSLEEKQKEMKRGMKEVPQNKSASYRIINKKAALLTVPHFMNVQELADTCCKMVADLNTRHIKNLIIDVRDNGGGSSKAVDSLLSYIAKTPYIQFEKVWTKVTPITQKLMRRQYAQGVNFYVNDKMMQPKSNAAQRYNGKVWVLMNHHSFSAAASFVWTVKAFKIGTLVGEEAGGMNVAYGDVVMYALPQSKLQVAISFKRFWLFGADENNIHGALPDIKVESSKALETVLERI
ncbi:S41 family peptidase [Prevotella falsenii]